MLRYRNIAIALALLPIFHGAEPSSPRVSARCWGDVNRDAKVNVTDAHLVGRFSIGLRVTNADAIRTHGDVTGDGQVNVSDAQQIARHSVGLPSASRLAGCSD